MKIARKLEKVFMIYGIILVVVGIWFIVIFSAKGYSLMDLDDVGKYTSEYYDQEQKKHTVSMLFVCLPILSISGGLVFFSGGSNLVMCLKRIFGVSVNQTIAKTIFGIMFIASIFVGIFTCAFTKMHISDIVKDSSCYYLSYIMDVVLLISCKFEYFLSNNYVFYGYIFVVIYIQLWSIIIIYLVTLYLYLFSKWYIFNVIGVKGLIRCGYLSPIEQDNETIEQNDHS